MAEPVTASDALAHFEGFMASEAEKLRGELPVIREFLESFGMDRDIADLSGDDIVEFMRDQSSATPADLEPLRSFLAYCSRLAFTESNLVPFLQLGPASGGARGGRGANAELGGEAFFVTLDGLKRLEAQLQEEKSKRPLVAEKLRDAMADKDFRENAPLDAARDEQAHLEMRIRDLEHKIRNAVIIDQEAKAGRANVGSVVRLLNLGTKKEQEFTLVSPTEVDPKSGKISIQSPVGVAVMNKIAGDEVTVNAPSGSMQFKIVEIIG
ncbi:MAG: transcription elongation factor GreA [Dehalococcoidia bacterium]